MFCTNCGSSFTKEDDFCPSCGTSVIKAPSPKRSKPVSEKVGLTGIVSKARLIFMAIAGLLCIMFFFPFISTPPIRWLGVTIAPARSVNGWRAIVGYEGEGAIFVSIFLFLLPVALLLLFLLKSKLPSAKLFTFSTILCGLSIVMFIVFAVSVEIQFEGMANLGAGFSISVILHVIATAFSVLCLVSARKNNN